MEELKLYIVKFDKNGVIKLKVYPSNCAIRRDNKRPIIIIIYH